MVAGQDEQSALGQAQFCYVLRDRADGGIGLRHRGVINREGVLGEGLDRRRIGFPALQPFPKQAPEFGPVPGPVEFSFDQMLEALIGLVLVRIGQVHIGKKPILRHMVDPLVHIRRKSRAPGPVVGFEALESLVKVLVWMHQGVG